MAIAPNKKYMAVAERADKAMITIYDLHTLKRRKVLQTGECGSEAYVSLAFSPDGKMLAAQGGAPEWNLVLWVWEKTKVGAMIKSTNQQASPIFQVCFNPSDGSLLTCAGSQIFKSFRVSEVPPTATLSTPDGIHDSIPASLLGSRDVAQAVDRLTAPR